MKKIFKEHLNRSFVKAVTFRVLVIISNTIIVFLTTGEIKLVFSIITLSTIINTLLYVIHERVWDRISWGRNINKK